MCLTIVQSVRNNKNTVKTTPASRSKPTTNHSNRAHQALKCQIVVNGYKVSIVKVLGDKAYNSKANFR